MRRTHITDLRPVFVCVCLCMFVCIHARVRFVKHTNAESETFRCFNHVVSKDVEMLLYRIFCKIFRITSRAEDFGPFCEMTGVTGVISLHTGFGLSYLIRAIVFTETVCSHQLRRSLCSPFVQQVSSPWCPNRLAVPTLPKVHRAAYFFFVM